MKLGPRATEGRRSVDLRLRAAADRAGAYPLGRSVRLAADDCWQVVTGTVQAFGALFQSKERGQLTSTVGIVRISAQALRVDFNYYLQIVGSSACRSRS